MSFLVDTNTCIQFLNRRSQPLIERLTDTPDHHIFVSSVTKAEMFYGSARSQKREHNLSVQRAFFARYQSLAFDDGAADCDGRIRGDLEDRGTPIGAMDLMIAAIAVANNLKVVTHNVREFERVSGLISVDWEI